MANRNWASGGKVYSMHVMPVSLDCQITVGTTGAVASYSGATVSSVVRNSAGNYTITFQDPYAQLLIAHGSMISPSSGVSGISAVEIGHATNVTPITGAVFVIQLLNASDAAADAASGSIIQFAALVNNSKVKTSISST